MKKYINISLILLAIISVFLTHSIVRAQQNIDTAKENTTKSIDYILPYPGILPDNPMYNIKMLRDKILGFLVTDPVKKAEYNLLMADKRISAGKMLFDYGKNDLGDQTLSKGQAYLTLVIDNLKIAKTSGVDVSNLMDKFDKAISKHSEVLTELLAKAPASSKKGLETAIANSQKFHDQVFAIMGRKPVKETEVTPEPNSLDSEVSTGNQEE